MNAVFKHRHPTATAASLLRRRRVSIELFLLFGLPVMSIAACAILAFVAYAEGYTEIAALPATASLASSGH